MASQRCKFLAVHMRREVSTHRVGIFLADVVDLAPGLQCGNGVNKFLRFCTGEKAWEKQIAVSLELFAL